MNCKWQTAIFMGRLAGNRAPDMRGHCTAVTRVTDMNPLQSWRPAFAKRLDKRTTTRPWAILIMVILTSSMKDKEQEQSHLTLHEIEIAIERRPNGVSLPHHAAQRSACYSGPPKSADGPPASLHDQP